MITILILNPFSTTIQLQTLIIFLPSISIGHTDQANHQYDLSAFWNAATFGNLPAVSFIKAPTYQDGHPIDSDPADERNFLVNTINRLQSLPEWNSTAIIITYDDSGGWYDHVPPLNSSLKAPVYREGFLLPLLFIQK